MTSGLGCDGESLAMTSATNPSLEDLLRGCLPGMPPVILYNPVLAYENGDDFMRAWHEAAAGRLDPFILVLEGSVANEEINGDGHWSGLGADPDTGQPITTNTWIDRLAPKAAAVLALGTCAAYGGIPAMRNNPTGAMGLRDYLGWNWHSRRGIPIINLPGCPVQPDNITETLLCMVLHLAHMGPALEIDEQGRPRRIFDRTVHETCNRAGMAEQGQFSSAHGDSHCLVKLGCKGPVAKCNVPIRGWTNGIGGCPERRWHLHRLHDAGVPRQVPAVRGAGRRCARVRQDRPVRPRTGRQVPARAPDPPHVRCRAGLAASGQAADDGVPGLIVDGVTCR